MVHVHRLGELPSLLAAARRTIGVSSWQRLRKLTRSSAFSLSLMRGQQTANSPQLEVREVNQSPEASLFTSGTKCASKSAVLCW